MNLVLHIPPDIAARLNEVAAVAGKPPEAIAMEALQDRLTGDNLQVLPLSPEQWRKKFDETLAGIPATMAGSVDDSRESIYEGRG